MDLNSAAGELPEPEHGGEMLGADDQLRIRVAWLYYVEGLTQETIGKRVGLTRLRVNRLLAESRDTGVVQFHIRSRLGSAIALEQRLIQKFTLVQAIVVPTPRRQRSVPQAIGAAAGPHLAQLLRPGQALGLGWGKTIDATVRNLPLGAYRDLKLVSLFGGLSRSAPINPYDIASRAAQVLGAACYYVTAPMVGGTPEATAALCQHAALQATFARMAAADLALISVGDLSPRSTNIEFGIIDEATRLSLLAAGAVGDIYGYYLDAQGRPVDHPANACVIMPPLDALRRIPVTVLASGGESKVPILRAVLRGGAVNTLITDEQAARRLLETQA